MSQKLDLTAVDILMITTILVMVWSSCRSETVTVVAFKNESLTFTCRSNATGLVWRRTVVSGTSLQIFSDTTFLVKQSADLYQLTILSVGQWTVGKYFVANQGSVDIECVYELYVIDVVADVSSKSDVITIGDRITVECNVTVYSRVEASMTLCAIDVVIGDNRGQNVSHSHELLSCQSVIDQKVVSVNSMISQKGYVQYFCTVVTQNGSQTFNTTKLQVSYPVQNVAINRSNNSLLLLDEVITCTADAFPPVFLYQWEEYNISSNKWVFSCLESQFAVVTSGILILRCSALNSVKNVTYRTTSDVVYFKVSTIRESTTVVSSTVGRSDDSGALACDDRKALIVGLCVAFVEAALIIVIVLTVYCLYKRKHKLDEKFAENSSREPVRILQPIADYEAAHHTNSFSNSGMNNSVGLKTYPQRSSSTVELQPNTYEKLAVEDDSKRTYAELRPSNTTVNEI